MRFFIYLMLIFSVLSGISYVKNEYSPNSMYKHHDKHPHIRNIKKSLGLL